jgi:hypothetical protein
MSLAGVFALKFGQMLCSVLITKRMACKETETDSDTLSVFCLKENVLYLMMRGISG